MQFRTAFGRPVLRVDPKGVALAFTLSVVGCSGGDDAAKSGATANYVVSTSINTGDNLVGYLTTAPSLDARTKISLDRAQELDGVGWIFGEEGKPAVYVASLDAPTIVRYAVGDDGSFEKQKVVDFSNLGVQTAYLAASAPIYSEQKSYFVDEDNDQLVLWNPARMQIIGAIPLGDEPEGSLMPFPDGSITVRDGLLLITVCWKDPNDYSAYGDHVRVIAVDPQTDTIASSSIDSRSNELTASGTTTTGTTYFGPYSTTAVYRQIGSGHGSLSNGLRVVPPAQALDQSYEIDLSALVGGRPAGDFTLLDDDTALIRAWNSDDAPAVTAESWQDVVWTKAAFYWWRWKLGDPSATQISGQSPGAAGSTIVRTSGKVYTTRYADDLSSTTMVEIEPSGTFKDAVTGPGQFVGNGVLRVR